MTNAPALNITTTTDKPHNTVYQAVLEAYNDSHLTHLELNTSEATEEELSRVWAYGAYDAICAAALAAGNDMYAITFNGQDASRAQASFDSPHLKGGIFVIDNLDEVKFEHKTSEKSREIILNAAAAAEPGLIVLLNY